MFPAPQRAPAAPLAEVDGDRNLAVVDKVVESFLPDGERLAFQFAVLYDDEVQTPNQLLDGVFARLECDSPNFARLHCATLLLSGNT